MKEKELTMSYTTTSVQTRKEATKTRSPEGSAPSTAMPFVFGLRRRAIKQIERLRDEIDPAVGSYSTD